MRSKIKLPWIRSVLAVLPALLLLAACANRSDGTMGEPGVPFAGRSGAQLWQENCARCHNPRSPSAYSDDQWQVALHHMRVRAHLTGIEQARILAFLKASN